MLPTVHIHAQCFNEELMLPYFLRHYYFADRIVIYDNGSTDGSHTVMANDSRVRRVDLETREQFLEADLMAVKNDAWKSSRGEADWVIACDVDEFLYYPHWGRLFADLACVGASVVRPIGFEMVGGAFPTYDGRGLTELIKHGAAHGGMYKCVLFNPNKLTEINFQPGCHAALPEGQVKFFQSPELKLLHYRKLGWEYFNGRHTRNASRLVKAETDKGWHSHLLMDEQSRRAEFDDALARAIQVIE